MKKVISSIISIIASSLLVVLIALITISQTVLKEEYVKKVLNNNNYIDKVYKSINKELDNYIPQLHIGDEDITLDNIVTKEMVTKDINNLISAIYNNKKIITSQSEIKKKLDIMINTQLNKYNRIPTKEEAKTIEEIKNNMINEYKMRVVFSEKYIPKVSKYYLVINNITSLAIKIILPLYIIVLGILFLINKKKKDYLKWIPISLLTTSVLSIAIKYIITAKISHILLLNENISEIIKIILKEIVTQIAVIGIILGIVSIILLILKVEEET